MSPELKETHSSSSEADQRTSDDNTFRDNVYMKAELDSKNDRSTKKILPHSSSLISSKNRSSVRFSLTSSGVWSASERDEIRQRRKKQFLRHNSNSRDDSFSKDDNKHHMNSPNECDVSIDSNATVADPNDVIFTPFFWGMPWTRKRLQHTGFFCVSSAIVLGVRLWLDTEPTAYFIHSIVVFLDMVLIHFFTHSVWLSVGGEIITVLATLAFTLTKETIYELLETTCIAILCSLHMISSRNKHMDREVELEEGVEHMREHSHAYIMQDEENRHASMRQIYRKSSSLLKELDSINDSTKHHRIFVHQPMSSKKAAEGHTMQIDEEAGIENNPPSDSSLIPPVAPVQEDDDLEEASTNGENRLRKVGAHFFEHFLDGSAGVMYTSFLGLIIDEIVKEYTNNDSKC